MSIFKGLFRSRDTPNRSPSPLSLRDISPHRGESPKNSYDSPSYTYFFGRAHSGKRVDDRSAMQHTVVYACVRVLSEAIAQLPLHLQIKVNSQNESLQIIHIQKKWYDNKTAEAV